MLCILSWWFIKNICSSAPSWSTRKIPLKVKCQKKRLDRGYPVLGSQVGGLERGRAKVTIIALSDFPPLPVHTVPNKEDQTAPLAAPAAMSGWRVEVWGPMPAQVSSPVGQRRAVPCARCCAVLYGSVRSAVLCSAVQCGAVLCCAAVRAVQCGAARGARLSWQV